MAERKKKSEVKALLLKFRKRGLRKCRFCGNARGVIRKYRLYICRRCFRETAESLGFRKF
ncbi:MAG: 30S ribosomal protein S14 [Candidatus Micrarchaeia archaeon]